MFPFPNSSPLLKRGVEVSAKGENVILRIGNVDLPMHYEHALDISRWIREEGRAAKALAGRGRVVSSLGTLHDASAKEKPLPLYSQGSAAIHVKTPLNKWRREDVFTQGRIVSIKIGGNVITLHFESALKVSQWIRLRAKEAKRIAGDTERHWSIIGNFEDLAK